MCYHLKSIMTEEKNNIPHWGIKGSDIYETHQHRRLDGKIQQMADKSSKGRYQKDLL